MTKQEKIVLSIIGILFLVGVITLDYFKATGRGPAQCNTGSCTTALYKAEIETASAGKIDLNSASLDQLIAIPGVGNTLAQRIMAFREKQPFSSLNELLIIDGIGDKTFITLTQYVYIDDASE